MTIGHSSISPPLMNPAQIYSDPNINPTIEQSHGNQQTFNQPNSSDQERTDLTFPSVAVNASNSLQVMASNNTQRQYPPKIIHKRVTLPLNIQALLLESMDTDRYLSVLPNPLAVKRDENFYPNLSRHQAEYPYPTVTQSSAITSVASDTGSVTLSHQQQV